MILKFYDILLLVLFVCIGCSKPSFADGIEMHYPKSDTLTYQKFNEGVGESGTSIVYIGTEQKSIPVRYYQSTIDAPPPPDYNFSKEEFKSKEKRDKRLTNIFYPKVDFVKYTDQSVN